MKLIAYSRILEGVAGLTGSTTTGNSAITATEQAELSRHIERALDEIWNHTFWPWLTKVQQRYFQPVWTAGTYAAGLIKYYTPLKKYYVALTSTSEVPGAGTEWAQATPTYSAGTYIASSSHAAGDAVYYETTDKFYSRHTGTGTELPTNTSYWGELIALEQSIDFEQTGEDEIGAVQSLHESSPLTTFGRPEVPWTLGVNGLYVTRDVPYVWVVFREPNPELRGSVWSAAATYAAGTQILYTHSDGTSDFWDVITTTSAGEDPEDTAAKFEKVEIPYAFKRFIEQKAFADYLLVRDRDAGLAERAIASNYLEELVVRTWTANGQTRQTRVNVRSHR